MNLTTIVKGVACIFVIAFLLWMHLPSAILFLASINAIICVISMFSFENQSFSLHKIVNIFLLIFFVLANTMQFSANIVVTPIDIHFTENDYLQFQSIVLVILALYNGLYYYVHSKYRFHVKSRNGDNGYAVGHILLLLSIIAFVIVLYNIDWAWIRLFVRGMEDDMREDIELTNVASTLIVGKFIRSIPFCCFMIYYIRGKRKVVSVLLFLIMLLTVFPSGLGRNSIALYWIPIVILFFPAFFQKRHLFTIFIVLAILFVFPFFDNFRYFNGTISYEYDPNYLNTMNYDASQEMMTAIQWNFITYGQQLLGVCFFFIPRSIWPTKPIGSGATLANVQETFSNISMPFWGEGYMNFGYLGIVLFTVILAIVTAQYDQRYWNGSRSQTASCYYLITIAALFFILRGDLLSSMSYTVGTLTCFFLVKKLSERTR